MVNSVPVYEYTKSPRPFFFIKAENYSHIDMKGKIIYYTKCYVFSNRNDGRLCAIQKALITSVVDECTPAHYISTGLKKAIMKDIFV